MARGAKAPFAAALACAAALLALVAIVYEVSAAQRIDSSLLGRATISIGEDAGSAVDHVAHLADPVYLLLLLGLACGIAFLRRRPIEAGAALIVVAGANLTAQAMKLLLSHPRLQPAQLHGGMPPDSLPSGHATAAASIAIAYLFVVPRSWRPAVAALGLCFVLAVDSSVVALAWHYPSDAVAGTILAAGWGFGVLALLRTVASEPKPAPPPQLASRAAISVK